MENKDTNTHADTVAVRCVADGRVDYIRNAVAQEWKQCKICNYIICNACIDEYQQYKSDNGTIVCPGSYFRRDIHNMDLNPVKLDEILLVAQKKQIKPATGLLIQRAFYQAKKQQSSLVDTLDDSMIFQITPADESGISVRQEEWMNMGSVIVKRKRGKYVMWERLGD